MKRYRSYHKPLLALLLLTIFFCLLPLRHAGIYKYFSFLPDISIKINDSLTNLYTYRSFKKLVHKTKLVAVDIDELSLSMIKERYPWKRSWYAKIVETLSAQGTRVIGFDTFFSGNTEAQEDELLRSAFKASPAKIILGCVYDSQSGTFHDPIFTDSVASVGMVNVDADEDGKLRSFFAGKASRNSLAVEMVAAYTGKPASAVIDDIPTNREGATLLGFMARPSDIVRVSAYELLYNLENLKKTYGADFLKDSMVLVFVSAEIIHDVIYTPLGKLPGGYNHINAILDMLNGKFLRQVEFLGLDLVSLLIGGLTLSAAFLLIGLDAGLGIGLLLLAFLFDLIIFRILSEKFSIWFNFGRIFLLSSFFFACGLVLKNFYFFKELMKIKDKTIIDPLRGIYVLRYFIQRAELDSKVRFGIKRYIFMIGFYPLKEVSDSLDSEQVQKLWSSMRGVFQVPQSTWGIYTAEEVAGYVTGLSKKQVQILASSLKNRLSGIMREKELQINIKVAYGSYLKKYSLNDLLFVAASELKKKDKDISNIDDKPDLAQTLSTSVSAAGERQEFLDSFLQDIEEKNRQLLSLLDNLKKEHNKTKEAFFQIITSLVNALEARDPYTEGHSERVSNYAVRIAEQLGWDAEARDRIKKAALLHDLGKIGIPDSILHKKDRLTEEEFSFIKKHEIIAVKIIEPLKDLNDIVPWILYHHERWDGKGYPHGLAGNAIPLAAQIISVSDVFDALMTGRDYKAAMSIGDALAELEKNRSLQFNPEVVDLFLKMMRESLVTNSLTPPGMH